MIPLDIGSAVLLYLMFALAAIFVLWMSYEKSEAFEKYTLDQKEVWECTICAYTYVDSTHDTISRCPQCKSLNKRTSE
jgi:rubrerythrin